MTTGLPEDNPWGDRQMQIDNAALERFVGGGLSFSNAPGQAYEYSNLGFVLLGKIVSKVSGMRFQDYITRQILLPLGMNNTRWEYTKAAPDKLALGYQWVHGAWQLEPILHDGDGAAMGGLITTMDDFARYVAFHLDASPARSGPDTRPAQARLGARDAAAARVRRHDAEGHAGRRQDAQSKVRFLRLWLELGARQPRRGHVGHSGGLPGYGSQYRFAPQHGIGIIAFSNLRYAPVYAPTTKALNVLIEHASLAPRAVAVSPILATRQAPGGGVDPVLGPGARRGHRGG